SAQSDVRAAFARQMNEILGRAGAAIPARLAGVDLGVLIGPHVEREQGSPHAVACSDQKLQCFGSSNRRYEVDRGIQDARGFAGLECSTRRVGEDTSQTGG